MAVAFIRVFGWLAYAVIKLRERIDPDETGVYLGQCAQYCGVQHATMPLGVYAGGVHRDLVDDLHTGERGLAFMLSSLNRLRGGILSRRLVTVYRGLTWPNFCA